MIKILTIFLLFIFIHKNTYSNDLNVSQKEIIQKMADFLECEPNTNPNQLEIIKQLRNSPGECRGFSALWVLGKRIQDKPNPDNEERDDNIFFNKAINLLLTKVNKHSHSLTPSEKNDVKRFISFILFFQRFSSEFALGSERKRRFDFNVAYNGLTGKNLQKPFGEKLELIVNRTILSDRLQKILRPGAMIMFGLLPTYIADNTGHQLAFYHSKIDGKIYFYDPNREKGEQSFSPQELIPINNEKGYISSIVDKIWSDLKLSAKDFDYETMYFKRLEIEVFYMPEDNAVSYEDLRLTESEISNLKNEAAPYQASNFLPLRKLQADIDFRLDSYAPANPKLVIPEKLSDNTPQSHERDHFHKEDSRNDAPFTAPSDSKSPQEDLSISRPIWWDTYNFKDFSKGESGLIHQQEANRKNHKGRDMIPFMHLNDYYYFMNLGFLHNGHLFIYTGMEQKRPTFKNLGAVDRNKQVIQRGLNIGERADMLADRYWTVDQGIIYEGWNPNQRTPWGSLIKIDN